MRNNARHNRWKYVSGEWGRKNRKYLDQRNKGKSAEYDIVEREVDFYYEDLEDKDKEDMLKFYQEYWLEF